MSLSVASATYCSLSAASTMRLANENGSNGGYGVRGRKLLAISPALARVPASLMLYAFRPSHTRSFRPTHTRQHHSAARRPFCSKSGAQCVLRSTWNHKCCKVHTFRMRHHTRMKVSPFLSSPHRLTAASRLEHCKQPQNSHCLQRMFLLEVHLEFVIRRRT